MELTQELKQQYQSYDHDALNSAFFVACNNGDLEVVTYLLTSPDLTAHADVHADDDGGFKAACENGHLEIVKYLSASSELKDYADLHADGDFGFIYACRNGYLAIVKYLLTSPELKEHADIHADNDLGFIWACSHGHVEVVKYLLTSPDLIDHADIHTNEDYGFQWACEYGYLEVVQYLLSFHGEQCIDFQRTDYNLDWALKNKHDNVIVAMMKNLKYNNFIEYFECLPKIEMYHLAVYEQVQHIERVNEINSQETVLYL